MGELTRVEFTNLDKILYPDNGIKKSQIIEYYIKIAPRMLNYLQDRAVVTKRFPDGIQEEGFYEKDAPKEKPSWIQTFPRYSKTTKKTINYIVCNSLDALLWLANIAAIEINVMLSRIYSYENPELVLFDLDPEPPADFANAVEVALLLREVLEDIGLKSYVKTSGKKGLHVVIPVYPKYTFKQTRVFAYSIGRYLAKKSDLVVSELKQSKDPGKVFIDYLQNSLGKTMICPYSLRATKYAPVSTPLEWKELKKTLRPEKLNIFNVPKRKKDPWEGILKENQKLEVN